MPQTTRRGGEGCRKGRAGRIAGREGGSEGAREEAGREGSEEEKDKEEEEEAEAKEEDNAEGQKEKEESNSMSLAALNNFAATSDPESVARSCSRGWPVWWTRCDRHMCLICTLICQDFECQVMLDVIHSRRLPRRAFWNEPNTSLVFDQ